MSEARRTMFFQSPDARSPRFDVTAVKRFNGRTDRRIVAPRQDILRGSKRAEQALRPTLLMFFPLFFFHRLFAADM